jgi:hypothetical protein
MLQLCYGFAQILSYVGTANRRFNLEHERGNSSMLTGSHCFLGLMFV